MRMYQSLTMIPSTSFVFQETLFNSNENILDETQRLIEEAEFKLRSMETGLSHDTNSTRPVYSSVDEHHLSSDSKNQRLKQALDNKMRKLEKQLENHWKKQVTASDLADIAVDPNATFSISQAQSSKRTQRSRVRRPCRKEADHGPQDVVDVVRTARDSVHGALLAAQKLSASLDNRTPRQSRRSASVMSIRPTSEIQAAGSDSTHLCPEHGTKRKVCSCLRPDYEGLKLKDTDIVKEEEGATPREVRKSNVGIFQAKCTASVTEVNRPLSKRLEVSVMPSLSIKRSLEKHVMPVIEVPFPGSNPECDKRENTGVRNFRYADSAVPAPKDNSSGLVQRACSEVSLKEKCSLPVSADDGAGDTSVSSAIEPHRSSPDLQDLDQYQFKQILEFLLEKVTAPQASTLSTAKRPPCHQQPTSTSKVDRPDESKSEKSSILSSESPQPVLTNEARGTQDHGESIAYKSLTRFLQTYSKAAAESKRARQKAAERRREEERIMKAQEQRFKSDAENQSNEGCHALIGPFRRAILKGSLRRNNTLSTAPSSNQIQNDYSPAVMSKEDSSDNNVMEPHLENEVHDETRSNHPEVTSEGMPSLKGTQHLEEKTLGSESEEKSKSTSQNSARSKSNSDEHPAAMLVPVQPPPKKEESSNDEYEEDWEEENEGDNNTEERVETRDVGDGSERDTHDEIIDGLAHTLRTIVEVEENSSLSVSLVHHEPVSQPTESGPIKSDSQPPSKSSLADADLVPSQTEKVQAHNSLMEVAPRTVVGKELPKSSEQAEVEPVAQSRTDEFSGNRAFLEMTESLKKMLEAVVSNLAQKKPESVVRTDSKTLGVRFESGYRSRIRRYDPTSSGSPNDDRVSSGSETSYSRSLRWNTQANRRPGGRVRFKTGSKRSSATQTEVGDEEWKRDAGTQVTPVKENEERKNQGWQMPSHLYLRPSTLSLERTVLRPSSRPISLSFDGDPTVRLLAFGKSASSQVNGVPAFSGAGTSVLKFSLEQERRASLSLCDSLSSSSSPVPPTDGLEFPANNTIMSLSEGEVLAYHSCSCSEGEICLCAGNCRKDRDCYGVSKDADRISDEPVVAERASSTHNHWSILDSTATDDLMDLSDHFSEGEVIDKLVEISHLLNGQLNE